MTNALEIEAQCRCGRPMRIDGARGRGHMVCGCGNRVFVHMPATQVHQPGMCTWVTLREGIIKIGFTEDLSGRMNGLRIPYHNLLAIERGDRKAERERLQQFASVRASRPGSREEFHEGGELSKWVEHLRLENGDPHEACVRFRQLKIADLRINGPLLYPRNAGIYDELERATRPSREAS